MRGEHKHPDKGERGVMSSEAGLAGAAAAHWLGYRMHTSTLGETQRLSFFPRSEVLRDGVHEVWDSCVDISHGQM